MEKIELTQEELDARINEAKKGLFTEEDFNRKLTSEVDRRVESGIQKGLETQKEKWEREFAEKAKLSAEELAKKQLEERQSELTAKEKEIQRKANLIEAKNMLADAQVPKSHYEKMISMLVSDDEDATKTNVQSFIDVFNSTKTELETKIKSEYAKVPPPKTGATQEGVSKEDFDKMGYAQKLQFKKENPELYTKFMK